MPLVDLSDREVKYLARMNGQNICIMQHMAKKNRTVFPDLPMAEGIQAKFAVVVPDGLPAPFQELAKDDATRRDRGTGILFELKAV